MVITDILPSQLSVIGYQASPGLVVTDTGHIPSFVWQVQDLAPGEGGAITITAVISLALTHTENFTNTATISSNAVDPNPVDNSSSATVMVGFPLADSPWPHHRRDLAQTGRSPYVGPAHPQVKWTFTANDALSSPSIGPDGTIYFGAYDYKFYAVNPDGSLKWRYTIDRYIFTAPAIAADGTICFGTSGGELYALNSDGTLKWWFYGNLQFIFALPDHR